MSLVIRFSRHARERMRERGIKKEDVQDALLKSVRTEHIEGDKFIAYYRINSATLAVVFMKRREYYTIITAYYENHI